MSAPAGRLVAVVEDEDTIREAMCYALKREGHQTEAFGHCSVDHPGVLDQRRVARLDLGDGVLADDRLDAVDREPPERRAGHAREVREIVEALDHCVEVQHGNPPLRSLGLVQTTRFENTDSGRGDPVGAFVGIQTHTGNVGFRNIRLRAL